MESVKSARLFWAASLVVGQSIELVSTFFWLDSGRHSVNGSVLVILGMVLWAVGFMGLFELFEKKNPWYARLGLVYAVYGCIGGVAFGYEGLYSQLLGIEKIGVNSFENYPLQMNLVLFWAGPAFPLSLLALGIMSMVRRVLPYWVGAMIAMGAIAFPISRILRVESVAHLADVVLLAPLLFVLWTAITNSERKTLYMEGRP